MSFLSKIFGDPNNKEIEKLSDQIQRINQLERELESYDQAKLRQQTTALKNKLKDSGTSKKTVMLEILSLAFAMVREASKRALGQRHFDVQLIGGLTLHQGKIAEMKTGEGKTLAATLPAFLNALTGEGVHIVTINDYLARRDAEWMGRIYNYLGLTVGCLQHESAFKFSSFSDSNLNRTKIEQTEMGDQTGSELAPCSRREAYGCDITYGTNNEFGFDYLRDNMVPRIDLKVQRGHFFAIVDEVDSILIDEARTPLIISAPDTESTDKYYQFAKLINQLTENEDFNIDEKLKTSTLTEAGIAKLEKILGLKNIYEEAGLETVHHLEQALRAKTLFKLDRDYVVKSEQVIIVDEFTGRLMPGRRFSEGLHQALEAKEGVEVQRESKTLATITLQNYFRMYKKLAGMTGTAATEAEEFSKIYNLDVITVPTNKPMIRRDLNDVIFKTGTGKFKAAVREIKKRYQTGQPILVGTISVEKSELLSEFLRREGVKHEVLNAKNHEREAKIIAQAGQRAAVTIATNMAGRGTDIVLGEGVAKIGGLHVLGTERHEARRIDNQLRGRSGRQGDQGSSQFFVSLEDDLMRIFGSGRTKAIMDRLGLPDDQPIEHKIISRSLEAAQKKVEGNNFDIRKHLVEYDDVLNKHREIIYQKRDKVLTGDSRKQLMTMFAKEFEELMVEHTMGDKENNWNIKEIIETTKAMGLVADEANLKDKLEKIAATAKGQITSVQARTQAVKYLMSEVVLVYKKRLSEYGQAVLDSLVKAILLRSIDLQWMQHLNTMEFLRQSVRMQAYAQKDPLVEYKKQSFDSFQSLLRSIEREVVNTIFKVQVAVGNQPLPNQAGNSAGNNQIKKRIKTGRNEPCPCGSDKKYKKCHGK